MINLDNFPKIKNDLSGNLTTAEYLVAIKTDPVIYISTTKQMFEGIEDDNTVYYEDLDLRVSNIKEKIDLKTKKIQLSSMSLSFNNFPINDVRLSDRMGNGLGKEISIYLKTASCQSIEDCVKVADLKINRYSHDKNAVKISADDKWVESFYIDLPKTLLEKDVNTFEAYNLKPVPILYGHLENAPALPYYDEGEDYSYLSDGVKVLPDSSYLNNDTEIQGIKQWNEKDGRGWRRPTDQLEDANVLKVRLSDSLLASIPIKPYNNTQYDIRQLHRYSQYITYNDHIKINIPSADPDAEFTAVSNDISLTGLWCSHLSKLINKKISVYTISNIGNWREIEDVNSENNTMKNIQTGFSLNSGAISNDIISDWFGFDTLENDSYFYKIGIFDLEFEQASGIDVYENESGDEFPRDVQFLGNGYVKCFNYSGTQSNIGFPNFNLYSIYSPYVYDESAISAESGNTNIATPNSFSLSGKWNLDSQVLDDSVSRNKFKLNGIDSGDLSSDNSYISNLSSSFVGAQDDYNNYESSYDSNVKYPILNSNNVAMYYTFSPYQADINSESSERVVDVETDWSDVKLRKYWKNKDIFEKDFFVNAKGRVDGNLTNAKEINAEIKVWYEGQNAPNNYTSHENKHLIELYKALTDSSMKYKNINGEVYELMLHQPWASDYIFDIDVNNFYASTNIHTSLSPDDNTRPYIYQDDTQFEISTSHSQGWVFEITAKIFGNIGEIDNYHGLFLVYAKKNIVNGVVESISQPIYHESLEGFNEKNGANKFNPNTGYTKIAWDNDESEDAPNLLESPEDIIGNLVTTEMTAGSVIMPSQETNMKFGFSINKQESSKDIIENICSQSNLFFRYSPRDGQAIIDTIKRTYGLGDIDKTISSDKILKYSFSKTKVDDLGFNGCKVRWGYDYGKEELANITGETSVSDEYIESYINEYGLEGADDISKFRESGKYKLEIEAPYINNEATALKLRDFMFQFYKNTHLIIKATLPIQEGIELEVGDLVGFDKNIGDLKPYGKDMYQNLNLNGEAGYMQIDQQILPYFLITSVSKTLDKVDIEVMQMHNLTGSPVIYGCTLPEYLSFNPEANVHVQSMCTDLIVEGCTHPSADNYDQNANVDDGSCVFPNASPIATFHTYIYDQNDEESTSLYSGGLLEFDASDSYDPNGDIGYNGIVSFQWDLEITYGGQVIDTPNELQNSVDIANQATSSAGYTGSYWLSIHPMVDHIGFGIKASLTVEDSEGATSTVTSIAPIIVNEAGVLPDDDGEQEGTGVLGDATQDGSFNVQDVVATVGHVLGNSQLEGTGLANADINSDGIVDILDIIAMMNLIVGDD